MLRLAIPIFLVSFPFVLIGQLTPCRLFLGLDFGCYPSVFELLPYHSWDSILSITWNIFLTITWAMILGIALGILWGIMGNMTWGIVGGIALGIVGGIAGSSTINITKGITLAIGLGTIIGIVVGVDWGIKGGIVGGIVGGVAWGIGLAWIFWGYPGIWRIGMQGGFEVAITFMISYLLSYYRLLLYPISGFSGFRAYRKSRKNPPQVFTYLHHSSLYWDERIFLPLPGLKHTLLIAAEQNIEQALKELSFIMSQRSQQIAAAQRVLLEIAIRDLEKRDTIRDIARASQRLTEILPQEVELIDPRWVTPFARLNDASRNAARYCSPLGRQARRDALEDMIANLESVYPNSAFGDTRLSKRLDKVVNMWRTTARTEQQKLEQDFEKIGQIDNPYNPGQVLGLRDTLFVGRRDLVQQLGDALSRGSHRPTFLLNGERRMGKSSTLKQLPNLLGARYLPILYDLQMRGISSSADTFLGTVAEEIFKALSRRGLKVKRLKYERLQEVSKKNEAAIYQLFDQWLSNLEPMLEQEDRTLLLLFDEFEKLEEAAQGKYLNLNLLLDWFRSVIQNRSRLALLFSGVRSFSEMGTNWAGYFVNVQTLKVSFLRSAEAHHLITQPIPNFPGEQVFGEQVVEEIIRVTGCHPFLIQAVCSALIDNLNAENRARADFPDVAQAVEQVLENWWDTFFRDLWERTNQEQRMCLAALSSMHTGDLLKIAQQKNLNEKTVQRTLQTLRKRDLVLHENGSYRIAAPIFCEWVDRNV